MMKKWLYIVFLIMLAGSVSAFTQLGNNTCSCGSTGNAANDCADCNAALATANCSSGVALAGHITNAPGSCISFPGSNLVLDCQNNTIDGSDAAGSVGVFMNNVNGNTVKYCTVNDFNDGIYIAGGSGNKIEFNEIKSNLDNGVHINNSNGNQIVFNVVSYNDVTSIASGIYIHSGSFSNILLFNTVNNNKYGIALTNSQSNFIDHNHVHNNQKNGIELYTSNSNPMNNNTVEMNQGDGIKITGSTGNVLFLNTIRKNMQYGINLITSTATIDNNTVCNNTGSDMYTDGTGSSIGDNNKCDKYNNWKDSTAAANGCRYICSGAVATQTCSDGTAYGACSSSKPQYCAAGSLVNNCTYCGCPSGQSCDSSSQGCNTPQPTCSDGTVYGSCSSNKPLYCDSGTLVDKCGTCGCVEGEYCGSDSECRGRKDAGKSCDSNKECKSRDCKDGVCMPEDDEGECDSDDDCGSLKFCKSGVCIEKKEMGEDCSRDAECDEGVCDGECVECKNDGNCDDEESCQKGECVKLQCAEGEVLRDHACFMYECGQNSDCAEDEQCSKNQCLKINCEYGDIVEHACIAWQCREDTGCTEDEFCDPETHTCKVKKSVSWLFGIIVSVVIIAAGLMWWQMYQKKKRWPLK